jgi:hypothetical protein
VSVYKQFIIIGGSRLTKRTFPQAMNSLKPHPLAVIGIFHTFGAKMIGKGERNAQTRKLKINRRGTVSLDGSKVTAYLLLLHDEIKNLNCALIFTMLKLELIYLNTMQKHV